jgi:hypothetical protein
MSDMTEVPRIHNPSRREFEAECVARNRPAILTGVIDRWPALSRWTPEYVKRAIGDTELEVSYSNPGRNNQTPRYRMSADEFFATVEDPRDEGNPYITLQPLPKVLEDDIVFPPLFDHESLLFKNFLFGCKTITELHYHQSTEAFFCCVKGSKRFLCYAPEDFPNMYARPFYARDFQHSHVIASAPDLRKYSKFSKARCIEINVQAGEVLYVPLHWWHAVYGSPALNINVTLFWFANARAVLFPKRGRLHQWASLLANRPGELVETTRRLLRGR